jgi:putative sigma-54 modulation protein
MEKIISGRHCDLTAKTKEHILHGLDRIESEYSKLTSARVVVDHQRQHHKVEVILHGKQIDIEAEAREENLWAAIDAASDRTERQLRKHLDKVQNHSGEKRLADYDIELAEAAAEA